MAIEEWQIEDLPPLLNDTMESARYQNTTLIVCDVSEVFDLPDSPASAH